MVKKGDRVSVNVRLDFNKISNRPSVAMRLVDSRKSGKTGLIIEPADISGWWVVLHDSPQGQGAVYHESELAIEQPPVQKYSTVPAEPESIGKRKW
jgi:hypothetical protein